MNRSARLTPVFLAALLAGLLAVLLATGWFSQQKAEQLQADVAGQSAMAAQLTALQLSARDSRDEQLAQATQTALDSLAPAVREVEVAEYEPVNQQLQSTVSALLDMGFAAQDAGDRARALTAALDVWQAAWQDGLVDQTYPEALADKVEKVTSYSCGDEDYTAGAPAASGSEQVTQPISVDPLQQSIYQLNYVSEVYSARAQQGYESVATQANQLADATAEMSQLAAPVLTCYGVFEAPEASYPLADASQAAQQLTDFTTAIGTNARAVLADSTLATSADDLEALAVILALETQQLES